MRQFSHECSKTNARVLQLGRSNKLYGEAHCMDAHASLPCTCLGVQPVDGKHDFFNRSARKFIAKDVDGNFLISVIKRPDSLRNAFDRRRVRKRIPVREITQDQLSTSGCIGYPLTRVSRKQVVPHVVHDLNALHVGVDIKCGLHLAEHALPGIGEHRARGIDDEDDVLAVDRNAANQLILLLRIASEQPLLFVA